MTDVAPAASPTVRQRWRTGRWMLAAALLVAAVAVPTVALTAPRPGGRLDAASTSPDGAHALVTLLRDRGVDVVVADDIAAVERAAAPDSLVVTVQTRHLAGEDVLRRLAAVPGDRLLVEPVPRIREALAPKVRRVADGSVGGAPECDLREATRAGDVQLGYSDSFEASGDTAVTRCYGGALVRYTESARTVTVVGTADFMANSGLLKQGNAALAMNIAGTQPRVVWYAPQRREGETPGGASLSDLIPGSVRWIFWQLCVVVLLVAVWKGRRLGPLVAERLPVVVRASETVEGRGRLYRSHRARDRAADALRTASLQRLLTRLSLGAHADQATIVSTITARGGVDPQTVARALFGPSPATDADLVNLAHSLDDIERQIAHP